MLLPFKGSWYDEMRKRLSATGDPVCRTELTCPSIERLPFRRPRRIVQQDYTARCQMRAHDRKKSISAAARVLRRSITDDQRDIRREFRGVNVVPVETSERTQRSAAHVHAMKVMA